MRIRVAALSAILVALVLPASGCSQIEAVFTPTPQVVTREATVAAASATLKGDLPENTPAGLPLWPGATVASTPAKGASYSLTLDTNDAYADVLSGITVGFQRAGWTVAQGSQDGSVTALDVSGENYEGVVTVSGNKDGSTTVEYLLTKTAQ